jgi:hypothetical protein
LTPQDEVKLRQVRANVARGQVNHRMIKHNNNRKKHHSKSSFGSQLDVLEIEDNPKTSARDCRQLFG